VDGNEYRKQLKRLMLSSTKCAKLFGYSERSSFRWNSNGPPDAVALVLKIAKSKRHLLNLIKTHS
jgi:hypothetical protein